MTVAETRQCGSGVTCTALQLPGAEIPDVVTHGTCCGGARSRGGDRWCLQGSGEDVLDAVTSSLLCSVLRPYRTASPADTSPRPWGSRAAAGPAATGTQPELLPSGTAPGLPARLRGVEVAPALRRPRRFPRFSVSKTGPVGVGLCGFHPLGCRSVPPVRPDRFLQVRCAGRPLPARDVGVRASPGVLGAASVFPVSPSGPLIPTLWFWDPGGSTCNLGLPFGGPLLSSGTRWVSDAPGAVGGALWGGGGTWPGPGKCPPTAQRLEPPRGSRPASQQRPLGPRPRPCQSMLKNLLFSFCCCS